MKTKIAIFGGKGMLGSDMAAKLTANSEFIIKSFDLPDFDVTNKSDVQFALSDADILINCAAYTDVDKAEEEQEKAFAVNADALSIIGEVAFQRSIYVVHISTDFVFDGTLNRPYKEEDTPNPLNVYGASKLEGEKNLSASKCRYSIVRVEWSYGIYGNNFIKKILSRASDGSHPIKVVSDQIGSPTWTADMADAILCLIKEKPQDALFHFANRGFASRFEVARFVFEKLGKKEMVLPCMSSEFPVKAKRPLNSCFDTGKIQKLLPYKIPHWQTALDKFMGMLFKCES